MKLLLAFFVCLTSLCLNAQSVILFEQDYISRTYTNVDISDDTEDFILELFFKNNTNNDLAVNWRREFSNNCPLAWEVFVSDDIISYQPDINESQLAIPVMVGDSNLIVKLHYYPHTVSGCCDIKMIFSLDGAPNNPIDTAYYQIEINAAGCLSSTLIEEEDRQLKIYPNPTSGTLNFEGVNNFESIEIFELSGKLRYQNKVSVFDAIDISAFPSGIYICKLRSTSGKVFTKKVVLQLF